MHTRLLAGFFIFWSAIATGQWLGLPTPGVPRTTDGEFDASAPVPQTLGGNPDISGLWVPSRVTGDLPDSPKIKDWVRDLMAERESNFYASNPRDHCLPFGPGYLVDGSNTYGYKRIVQGEDMIAILYPDLAYRQIFMDGRELEPDPLPTWMGYSVGEWQGDQLVVRSNGYNEQSWLHREGVAHTDQLEITEVYERTDFGHMQIDVTYDDPEAFHEPLEVRVEMSYVADDELLEIVCNESSIGTSHYSGEMEQVENQVVEVPEETLQGYTGTYEGLYLENLVRATVTLEDGSLFLKRGNREREEMIPQSETTFVVGGWGYVFRTNDAGQATELSEVHVSGGWTFKRVD